MTSGQRKLVWTWTGGLLLLMGVVAAWRYLPPKLHFLIALGVLPFAAIARARTTLGDVEERGRASLNEFADEYPWIKWWVVAWGITFFCGAIALSRSSYRVEEQDTLGLLLVAFAIVLGPLVALSERDRFRDLGK
jgi:hypothetical protein